MGAVAQGVSLRGGFQDARLVQMHNRCVTARKEKMLDEAREEYRGCTLIVRTSGGTLKGKAWKGNRELGAAQGGDRASVLEQLKAIVDQLFTTDAGGKSERYPTADDYRKAFLAIQSRLPDGYIAMLRAHYLAPGRVLTTRQLAHAAAYRDWQSANLHYGTLGKMVGEELLFQPRLRPGTEKPIWTLVLATGPIERDEDAEFPWTMRDEVAAAIETLGIVSKDKRPNRGQGPKT